jgi:gas vesicle protein
VADNTKGFLLGILIGGIAGAATGILCAPKSGVETREQMKKKALDAKEKATETARNVKESAEKATAKSKELVETGAARVRGAVEAGRQAAADKLSRIKPETESGGEPKASM